MYAFFLIFFCFFNRSNPAKSAGYIPFWASSKPENIQYATPHNRQLKHQSHHLCFKHPTKGFFVFYFFNLNFCSFKLNVNCWKIIVFDSLAFGSRLTEMASLLIILIIRPWFLQSASVFQTIGAGGQMQSTMMMSQTLASTSSLSTAGVRTAALSQGLLSSWSFWEIKCLFLLFMVI